MEEEHQTGQWYQIIRWVISHLKRVRDFGTEEPRYNDSVCYQRFCCEIEFAVIKKLDIDLYKASVMDTFEHFFINHTFCVFIRIASERRF